MRYLDIIKFIVYILSIKSNYLKIVTVIVGNGVSGCSMGTWYLKMWFSLNRTPNSHYSEIPWHCFVDTIMRRRRIEYKRLINILVTIVVLRFTPIFDLCLSSRLISSIIVLIRLVLSFDEVGSTVYVRAAASFEISPWDSRCLIFMWRWKASEDKNYLLSMQREQE